MIKFIMFALTTLFFKSKIKDADLQEETLTFFKKTFRKEVSIISFKLLVGVVLVSIIVFSTIQLGKNFQVTLSQFSNEIIFGYVTFGLIAVGCGILLYLLFNGTSQFRGNLIKSEENKIIIQSDRDSIDFQVLAGKFAEGLILGFSSGPHRKLISLSDQHLLQNSNKVTSDSADL